MGNLRFSRAAVENIALLLATDVEPREIAETYRCHASTISRIKQNVAIFGDPQPAPVSVQGRPRKITVEALEGLLDWVLENGEEHKTAYLDEMRYFLEDEYDIEVSKQTISRVLRENDITRKAVSIVALEMT
jgi:transposase